MTTLNPHLAPELELILGGARSGKSRLAERRALAGGNHLFYIATATAGDSEMAERIGDHKERRGPQWRTVEEPVRLAATLRDLARHDRCLLVDCLTLWLSNCLHQGCWQEERDALLATLAELPGRILLVSNEVGSGIVPLGELSRRFADESGWLHQQLAQMAQRVTLVVAGLPVELKTLTPDSRSPMDCSPGWLSQPTVAVSQTARDAASARQNRLTKPPGSLGRLEELAIDFAGWQDRVVPSLDNIRVRIFAADHGIAVEGVSAFPQAVTVEMIRNFASGGAAISVLSRRFAADFRVVNMGTVTPLAAAEKRHPDVCDLQLAPGSANICREPAMSEQLLAAALAAGANEIHEGDPCDLFIGGEMGIANTASTAALASMLLDLPATETVGSGTGVDDVGLARKTDAVERALARHRPHCQTPLEALRRLGGLEIAALVGAYIAAAQRGIPSLVDGYICTAAALVACRINSGVRGWLLFGHRSREPGHRLLLEALDAQPLLDLGLHLGEGSGAAMAVPLLQSACALHRDMATFAEAGVSGAGE